MDIFLFLAGGIGFLISIVFLFINIIRKKKTKKPLVAGGICIFIFIVSLSMPIKTPKDNSTVSNKKETVETSTKGNEELSQQDLNDKLKKEAVKADFIKLNGHTAENENLRVFVEGEISCVDYKKVMDVFPSFLITQKENDGYGVYHITNIFGIENLKDGDNVKVYGTVDKETSKDGIIKINVTVIEKL